MTVSSSSLLVPLVFPGLPQLGSGTDNSSSFLEASYYRSQQCVVKSWGTPDISSAELKGVSIMGVVVGSKDGTLYVFNQSRPSVAAVQQGPQPQLSRSTSPPLRESRATSPASTPSASSPAPFNVTSRPGIVSGVTKEQVEAPKTYVDFDDEPYKLKDMLTGRRSPRESKETPNGSDVDSKVTLLKPPNPSLKRGGVVQPLLPAIEPPAVATTSTSSSTRGRTTSLHDMTLWCHIVPSQTGHGRAVTSIHFLARDDCLAVLQEMGDLSIFSLQDGSCLATINAEHIRIKPPDGIKDRDVSHDVLVWSHLEVYRVGETTVLLASATVDPNAPSTALDADDNGVLEKSQLAMFEYTNDELAPLGVRLVMVGQWYFDGPAHGVGVLQESDYTSTFFSITPEGHFVVRKLRLLPRVPAQMEIPASDAQLTNLPSLPLPNPFKAMKSRHDQAPHGAKDRLTGRIAVDQENDLGELLLGGSLSGLRTCHTDDKLLGIAWSPQQLTAFYYQDGTLRVLFVDPVADVKDLEWIDDLSYVILFRDRAECHAIELVNPDNNHVDATVDSPLTRAERIRTLNIGSWDAAEITSTSEILTVVTTEEGCKLTRIHATAENPKPYVLWHADPERQEISRETRVTSRLPLELDIIIEGYADGRLRQSSLIEMCGKSEQLPSHAKVSAPALPGYITSLHAVYNSRTKEKFIIGGADDGSIAFWTVDHFRICARWTVFTTPLASVLQVDEAQSGPLKGCALCISADGTIAVIGIDGFQFLYLIPGAAASLRRVCLGMNNLLLVYANNRARLWDVQTTEFWRSMSLDKVDELLDQGGWTDLSPTANASLPNTPLKPVPGSPTGIDVASTIILDLEQFTSESIAIAKTISTNRDQTRAILQTLERFRSVLSTLLTPGLNEDIDGICVTRLGIQLSPKLIGFASYGSVVLYNGSRPSDPWCISGDVSAAHALSITVVLRALSLFEEYMENANTVMMFYATSLASSVGPYYQPPSLMFLAKCWFDGSSEIRQAARVLFDHVAACMSDEETNTVTEQWQHHLPCLQPSADREAMHAALALFLCGYLASQKYSLLSASALTDISKSIALYLHDEQSLHRVLAVDLCSRGFHVWQHYIDAMEILRALFTLATTPRKDAISVQNVGAQARLAILQIASSNTALFMTTLGLDILTPSSLEHRRSVMQVVAFIIRKRPLVLQPNIPKLMEAVVKSLDPNATTHREAILGIATEIIGYVVKTFPTVDFHMASQRLAVGSSDGAIVMYDLKTATRLYVLEQHKKSVAACSFSPDGRRLVSLSLEEGLVLVWKVGSSFTSFFNPGAPPRQGHGGSQPFKTINFNVGDGADMSVAETLEFVNFEWVAERSVKVKIKESILTFST